MIFFRLHFSPAFDSPILAWPWIPSHHTLQCLYPPPSQPPSSNQKLCNLCTQPWASSHPLEWLFQWNSIETTHSTFTDTPVTFPCLVLFFHQGVLLVCPKYFLAHSSGAHLLGINPSMSVTLFWCIGFVRVISEPLMFSTQCYVCPTEPIAHNFSRPAGGWVSIELAAPQADSSPLDSLFFQAAGVVPLM